MPRFQLCVLIALLLSLPATAQLSVGFEACIPGMGTLPCPSGWATTGGRVDIVPDATGTIANPAFGFPTEGLLNAIVSSAGATGSLTPPPAGGPAPYPLAAGSTGNVIFANYTIPAPPPGFDVVVKFDFTYCTPECPADVTYNDFMTVDIVDPLTGASLFNILYRDTFSASLASPIITTDAAGLIPTGFCLGMEQEEAPQGAPKSVTTVIPAAYHNAFANLEFHVGNATDAGFSGYFWLDNVEFAFLPAPLAVTLSSPNGPGSIQLDNTGLVPGLHTFNAFTINEPCVGGIGTGPYVGLCTNDLFTLVYQVSQPVGTPPFHYMPTSSTYTFGPLPGGTLPSGIILEAVCVNGTTSSLVVQHTIP